jgi:hypothetical protein
MFKAWRGLVPFLLTVSLGLSVGCTGEDGRDGESQLVLVTPEPEGASCAFGGQKIQTGADTDGNGVLDEDEVEYTHYVCNGEGLVSLVDPVELAPGSEQCEFGGILIRSGLDRDRDGVLDDSEVTDETPFCRAPYCGDRRFSVEPTMVCPVDAAPYATGLNTVGNAQTLAVDSARNAYVQEAGSVWQVAPSGSVNRNFFALPAGITVADVTASGDRVYVLGYDSSTRTYLGYLDAQGVYQQVFSIGFLYGHPRLVAVLDPSNIFITFSAGSGTYDLRRVTGGAATAPVETITGEVRDMYADPAKKRLYFARNRGVSMIDLSGPQPGPHQWYLSLDYGPTTYVTTLATDHKGRLYGSCTILSTADSACPTGGLWVSTGPGSVLPLTDSSLVVAGLSYHSTTHTLYVRGGTSGFDDPRDILERLRVY